jgi:hypothetical protein
MDSDSDSDDHPRIRPKKRYHDPKDCKTPCDWPFIDGEKCVAMFATEEEMKEHKEKQHEYCRFCNLDFEFWEDHHQHRVDVDRENERDLNHIVCRHCGLQAKTREARNAHCRKAHPITQELFCPVCKDEEPYIDARTFMRHIEDGRCPRIGHRKLISSFSHKQLVNTILKDPPGAESVSDDGDSESEEEGGVSLLNRENEPLPDYAAKVLTPQQIDRPNTAKAKPKAWDKLNAAGELFGGSTAPMPSSSHIEKGNQAAPSAASPQEPQPDNNTSLIHHQLWNPYSEDYNPKLLFNSSTGEYVCPFPDCGYANIYHLIDHANIYQWNHSVLGRTQTALGE